MGQVCTSFEPELEGSYIGWQGAMWEPLFDVGSCEDCKGPEVIAEICINEHGTGHATYGKVCSFGNTILWRGVGDSFLVQYAMLLTV